MQTLHSRLFTLPRFIVDPPVNICDLTTSGTNYGKGGLLTAPVVPGGTNYSAVDSPGGPLLGGTNYSMTRRLLWLMISTSFRAGYTSVTAAAAHLDPVY